MGHRGFYLVELMLVVMTILSLSLFYPIVNNKHCEIKSQTFLKVLQMDINYHLTYTMTHYTTIRFQSQNTVHQYKMIDGHLNTVTLRSFDNHLNIEPNFTIMLTHGFVVSPITFVLSCGDESKYITIEEKSGLVDGKT